MFFISNTRLDLDTSKNKYFDMFTKSSLIRKIKTYVGIADALGITFFGFVPIIKALD